MDRHLSALNQSPRVRMSKFTSVGAGHLASLRLDYQLHRIPSWHCAFVTQDPTAAPYTLWILAPLGALAWFKAGSQDPLDNRNLGGEEARVSPT